MQVSGMEVINYLDIHVKHGVLNKEHGICRYWKCMKFVNTEDAWPSI